ncbi:MAG: hypothetical protein ACK4SY_05435 [Pyrobaculum sp.]
MVSAKKPPQVNRPGWINVVITSFREEFRQYLSAHLLRYVVIANFSIPLLIMAVALYLAWAYADTPQSAPQLGFVAAAVLFLPGFSTLIAAAWSFASLEKDGRRPAAVYLGKGLASITLGLISLLIVMAILAFWQSYYASGRLDIQLFLAAISFASVLSSSAAGALLAALTKNVVATALLGGLAAPAAPYIALALWLARYAHVDVGLRHLVAMSTIISAALMLFYPLFILAAGRLTERRAKRVG